MISHDEALVYARQHLYTERPPSEWVWVLRAGHRALEGWYFNYELEPLRFIRDQDGPQFGGAPGFLVTDEGQVKVVGWVEHARLFPKKDEHGVA